jgi:hypothetical protein
MGPYAGVDYNLILCPLQSRLQHIQHEQPCAIIDQNRYARVDFSTLSVTLDLASGDLTKPALIGDFRNWVNLCVKLLDGEAGKSSVWFK